MASEVLNPSCSRAIYTSLSVAFTNIFTLIPLRNLSLRCLNYKPDPYIRWASAVL